MFEEFYKGNGDGDGNGKSNGKPKDKTAPLKPEDFLENAPSVTNPFSSVVAAPTSRQHYFNPKDYADVKNVTIYDDPNTLEKLDIRGQSFGDKMGNAGIQFMTNLISGAGQGFANTWDMVSNFNMAKGLATGGDTNFESSLFGLSTADMRHWAEDINNRFRIKSEERGDTGWLLNQVASAGTGVGMAVDAAVTSLGIEAATGGLGSGAALLKLGNAFKRLLSLGKAAEGAAQGLSAVKGMRSAGIMYSGISRLSEAKMEAASTAEQIYNELSTTTNPRTGKEYTEEEKRHLASEGAKVDYVYNMALLPVDILAFRAMTFNPISGTSEGFIEKGLERVGKGVAKGLGNGKIGKAAGWLTTKGIGVIPEGFEEVFQGIGTSEGVHYAKSQAGQDDGDGYLDRLKSTLTSGETFDNFAGGIIGAPVIGGIMNVVQNTSRGAHIKRLGDEHKAYIANAGKIGTIYGTMIKELDKEGKHEEASDMRLKYSREDTLDRIHLDAMVDKDTAFDSKITALQGVIDELKQGKTDGLEDMGYFNTTPEQHQVIIQEYEQMIKDAHKMKELYNGVKNNYSRTLVPTITREHFNLHKTQEEIPKADVAIAAERAKLVDWNQLTSNGKEMFDAEHKVIALKQSQSDLIDKRRGATDRKERENLDAMIEEKNRQIQTIDKRKDEINKDDTYSAEDRDRDNDIREVNRTSNLSNYTDAITWKQLLEDAATYHRKNLTRWNDTKYTKEVLRKSAKNSKTVTEAENAGAGIQKEQVKEKEKEDAGKGKVTTDEERVKAAELDKQIHSEIEAQKKKIAADEAVKTAEQAELEKKKGDIDITPEEAAALAATEEEQKEDQLNLTPEQKAEVDDIEWRREQAHTSLAKAEPKEVTKAVKDALKRRGYSQKEVDAMEPREAFTSLINANHNAELDRVMRSRVRSNNVQLVLSPAISDDKKPRAKKLVSDILSRIGRDSTFQQVVEEIIRQTNEKTAQELFNRGFLGAGWELNGKTPLSDIELDRVWNNLWGSIQDDIAALLADESTPGGQGEESQNQTEGILASNKGPDSFDNNNQPNWKYEKDDGRKTYVTHESSPKAAFKNSKDEMTVETDQDGNAIPKYEATADELNQSKDIDDLSNLDYDKRRPGEKTEMRVPSNVDEIYITLYNNDGTVKRTLKWKQYLAENPNLKPADQDYRDKIPIIIYEVGAEKGWAFVHDVAWYHESRFDASYPDSMAQAIASTRAIRDEVLNNHAEGKPTYGTVTGKRETTFADLKTEILGYDKKGRPLYKQITIREANPQAVFMITDRDESGENTTLKTKRMKEEGQVIALRTAKKSEKGIKFRVGIPNNDTSLHNKEPFTDVGDVVDVRRYGYDAQGRQSFLASPVLRPKLTQEAKDSVVGAITIYMSQHNQNPIIREQQDKVHQQILDTMGIDIKDEKGLKLYVRHFINPTYISNKIEGDNQAGQIAAAVKAKGTKLGRPYVVFIHGQIIFGRAGMNILPGTEAIFLNKGKAGEFNRNGWKTLNLLTTSFASDEVLGEYEQSVDYEALNDNKPLVMISGDIHDKNFRVTGAKKTHNSFNDYLLDTLTTNIRSINIGTKDDPKYITNVQPVITYDTDKRLGNQYTSPNDQQIRDEERKKKEVTNIPPAIASVTPADVHKAADKAGVAWDNSESFMNKSEELTGKRHLDDMSEAELQKMIDYLTGTEGRARLEKIVKDAEKEAKDILGTDFKEEGNIAFSPAVMNEQQMEEVRKGINKIWGLTDTQESDLMRFIDNQITDVINEAGGKIKEEDIKKAIRKIFDTHIQPARDLAAQKAKENRDKLIADPELGSMGINNVIVSFETRGQKIRDIERNLDTVILDKTKATLEKYKGVKMTEEVQEDIAAQNGADENDHGSEINPQDSFEDVLTMNPDDRLGHKMRRFLNKIRVYNKDGVPQSGFLGLDRYEDGDTVVKTLMTTLADIPSDFDTMMRALEERSKGIKWMQEVITRLKDPSTDNQMRQAFVTQMRLASTRPVFAMVIYDAKTRTYRTKLWEATQNSTADTLKASWKNNFLNGPLVKHPATGEILLDKAKAKEVLDQFDSWRGTDTKTLSDEGEATVRRTGIVDRVKGDMQSVTTIFNRELNDEIRALLVNDSDKIKFTMKGKLWQITRTPDNKFEVRRYEEGRATKEEAEKWLGNFGIVLSPEAMDELYNKGLLHNGKQVVWASQFGKGSTNSLFSNLYQTLYSITEVEGINFATGENNPIDLNSVVTSLANHEAKYNDTIMPFAYRTNKKSLFTLTAPKYMTDRAMGLKAPDDKLHPQSQLRKNLKQTSYANPSLWLTLLHDEKFRHIFNVGHIAETALQILNRDVFGDNSLAALSDMDHEQLKVGLFQDMKGKDIVYGDKDSKKYMDSNILLRIGTMLGLTMSDKHLGMGITTAVLDLRPEDLNKGQLIDDKVVISDQVKEILYQQLVKPELGRMLQYFKNLQDNPAGTNITGYDKGAKMFFLLPALNNLPLGGTTLPDYIKRLAEKGGTLAQLETGTVFKNAIYENIGEYVNKAVQDKLVNWKETGFGIISPGREQKGKHNPKYMEKFSSADHAQQLVMAAMDFEINNLVSNANEKMLFSGDPALFYKKNGATASDDFIGIAEDTFVNVGKRLALLIAPGTTLADSEKDKYIQLFIKDREGVTATNIKYLERLHGSDGAKMYRNISNADAQEFTTWKEHLDILTRMGRTPDGMVDITADDIQEAREIVSSQKINRKDLDDRQLELLRRVFQPMKPVYTGQVFDSHQDVMRTVYVKSSSFPLIPQLTEGLEIDKLRLKMEEIQDKGLNVRASFQTANKVGSMNNAPVIFDAEGNIDEEALGQLEISSLTLPRSGFRIQQEVPFKSGKEGTIEDKVTYGTQMMKHLFGEGILDHEEFYYKGEKKTGKELKEMFDKMHIELIEGRKKALFDELELNEDGTSSNQKKTNEKIQEMLEEEADKRDYPQQDKRALKLDKNGDFWMPLWASGNSDRHESMLNSIITNKMVKIKFPGYSYVLGSEEGFREQTGTGGGEYKWARTSDNNYEVSSSGDKRFSAFYAQLKDGRYIEDIYQLDIKGNGKAEPKPVTDKQNPVKSGISKTGAFKRGISREASWEEYKDLWRAYLKENPDLRGDLEKKAEGKTLTDRFASTDVSQARALAEILNEKAGRKIQAKTIDELSEETKSRIIYTPAWNGSHLEASFTVDKEGNQVLKRAQVMVTSKFRDNKGKLIDLFEKTEDGKDYKFVEAKDGRFTLKESMFDKDLLTLFGYRLPTPSLNAGSVIEIAGFLPAQSADLMIASQNFVVQMGSDFDVDKFNTYQKWHHQDKEGGMRVLREEYINEIMDAAYKELEEKGLKDLNKKYRKATGIEALRLKKQIDNELASFNLSKKMFTGVEIKIDDLGDEGLDRLKNKIHEKLKQNDIIEMYHTIFGSAHDNIQRKITKPLSTKNAESQADMIDALLASRRDQYWTPLSSEYQKSKLMSGSAGKTATAAFALDGVFNSLAQSLAITGNPMKLIALVKNEDGNTDFDTRDWRFGKAESFAILGANKAGDRNISEVIAELLQIAVDNEKLQVLGRVGINGITLDACKMFSLTGLDKGEDGDSIAFLFLSQPIIKDYVRAIQNADSVMAEYEEGKKEKVINDLLEKYKDDAVDINKAYWNEMSDNMTNANLKKAISSGGIGDGLQGAVLRRFLEMDAFGKRIRQIQTSINTDSKGLGKSFFDVIQKRNALNSLGDPLLVEGAYSEEKGVVAEMTIGAITGADKLIGEYISTKVVGIGKPPDEGYINMGEFWVKPTTLTGAFNIHGVSTAYNLWRKYFPYDEAVAQEVFKEVLDVIGGGRNISPARQTELKQEIFKGMKKYFYTSTKTEGNMDQGITNFGDSEDANTERYRLYIDDANNTSLCKYIKTLREKTFDNPVVDEFIKKSKLLGRIQYEVSEQAGKPSVMKFNAAAGEDFDEEYIYNALSSMLTVRNRDGAPIELPTIGNKPYTVDTLAQDIIAYCYLGNSIQEATQFTKFAPIEYLNAVGVTTMMRGFHKDLDGTNNNFQTLGLKPHKRTDESHRLSEFSMQYIQSNPERIKERLDPKTWARDTIDRKDSNGNPTNDLSKLFTFRMAGPAALQEAGGWEVPVYPPFKAIRNYGVDKGQEKMQIYYFDGNKYVRVPVLGTFGMDEYQMSRDGKKEHGVSIIHEPKTIKSIMPSGQIEVLRPLAQADTLAIDTGDINQVLQKIIDSNLGGLSTLAKALLPHVPQGLTIAHADEIYGQSGYNGVYFRDKKEIFISLTNQTVNGNTYTAGVVMHELVHALTMDAIDKYTREDQSGSLSVIPGAPRYAGDIIALYNELRSKHNSDELQAILKKVKGGQMLTTQEFGEQYGLTDIYEFMAMAFGNAEFQKYLSKTEFKQSGKTMLEKLQEIVANILASLGVKFESDTAAAHAIGSIFQLITEENKNGAQEKRLTQMWNDAMAEDSGNEPIFSPRVLTEEDTDQDTTGFVMVNKGLDMNLPEAKKLLIYNNYVSLMNRKREGKGVKYKDFVRALDSLQVFNHGNTYVLGEWDTANQVFKVRLISAPGFREFNRGFDALTRGVDVVASVPSDMGSILTRKGFFKVEAGEDYNFRGEEMTKHLYFSSRELAERVFKTTAENITPSQVKKYDAFFNYSGLINKLKAVYRKRNYDGIYQALRDLGIYDYNAYRATKKLQRGQLTEHEAKEIVEQVLRNSASNKVNINKSDVLNNPKIYDGLQTELNKILATYLSKFGITTNISNDKALRDAGVDTFGAVDILNKILHVSETNQENYPAHAGKVIAFMMQHNPLVSEIKDQLKKHARYKHLSHDEIHSTIGELIAEQLHKKTDTELPQSLLDNIRLLIEQFFDHLNPNRLARVNRNVGIIADNVLLQNQSLITANHYKPGKEGMDVKKIGLNEALKNDKFAEDIVNKMASKFILTGSITLSEQGDIFRPVGNEVHDLDWVSSHSLEETKRIFKEMYPDAQTVRTIEDHDNDTVTSTYIVVPEGTTIKDFEMNEKGDKIAGYDIVDKDGKVVSRYNPANDTHISQDGIEAKCIDLFSAAPWADKRLPTKGLTLESGVEIRVSDWRDTFKAKLRFGRIKDIWDYNRFIPEDSRFDSDSRIEAAKSPAMVRDQLLTDTDHVTYAKSPMHGTQTIIQGVYPKYADAKRAHIKYLRIKLQGIRTQLKEGKDAKGHPLSVDRQVELKKEQRDIKDKIEGNKVRGIQGLEAEIEELEDLSMVQPVQYYAEKDIDRVAELALSEDPADLDEAAELIEFYSTAADFEWHDGDSKPSVNPFFEKDDIFIRDPVTGKLTTDRKIDEDTRAQFAEWARKIGEYKPVIDSRRLDMADEVINADVTVRNTFGDKKLTIADVTYGEGLKDIDYFSMWALDPNQALFTSNGELPQIMSSMYQNATEVKEAWARDISERVDKIKSQVEKKLEAKGHTLTSKGIKKLRGVSWQIFKEITKEGNETHGIVRRFSPEYESAQATAANRFRREFKDAKTSSNPSLAYKEAFRNWKEWKINNTLILDPSKIQGIISDPEFNEFAGTHDPSHEKELIDLMGQRGFDEMVEEQKKELRRYQADREYLIDNLLEKYKVTVKADIPEEGLDQLDRWEDEHSPAKGVEEMNTTTKAGYKISNYTDHNILVPRKTNRVTNEPTGHYSAPFAEIEADDDLREFYEIAKEVCEKMREKMSPELQEATGAYTLPGIMKTAAEILADKDTGYARSLFPALRRMWEKMKESWTIAKEGDISPAKSESGKSNYEVNDAFMRENGKAIGHRITTEIIGFQQAWNSTINDPRKRINSIGKYLTRPLSEFNEGSLLLLGNYLQLNPRITHTDIKNGDLSKIEAKLKATTDSKGNKVYNVNIGKLIRDFSLHSIVQSQSQDLPMILKHYSLLTMQYAARQEILPMTEILKKLHDDIRKPNTNNSGRQMKNKSGKKQATGIRDRSNKQLEYQYKTTILGHRNIRHWGVGDKTIYTQEEKERIEGTDDVVGINTLIKNEEDSLAAAVTPEDKARIEGRIKGLEEVKNSMGRHVAWSAILTSIGSYIRGLRLGYNISSGVTNAMEGMASNNNLAAQGIWFNQEELAYGYSVFKHSFYKNAMGWANIETEQGRKLRKLMDKYNVLVESKDVLKRAEDKSHATSKFMTFINPYAITSRVEYANQSPVLVAMMRTEMIKGKDSAGNEIESKVWDAFDANGKLQPEYRTAENIYNWEERKGKEYLLFKQRLKECLGTGHGHGYNEQRGMMAKSEVAGSIVAMFKTWLPSAIYWRFGAEQVNLRAGQQKFKGYYRSHTGITGGAHGLVVGTALGNLLGGGFVGAGVGMFVYGGLAAKYGANSKFNKDGVQVSLMEQTLVAAKSLALKAIGFPVNIFGYIFPGKQLINTNVKDYQKWVAQGRMSEVDARNLSTCMSDLSLQFAYLAFSLIVKAALKKALEPDDDDDSDKKTEIAMYNITINKLVQLSSQAAAFSDPVATYKGIIGDLGMMQFLNDAGKLGKAVENAMEGHDKLAGGVNIGKSGMAIQGQRLFLPGMFKDILGDTPYFFGFGSQAEKIFYQPAFHYLFEPKGKREASKKKANRADLRNDLEEQYTPDMFEGETAKDRERNAKNYIERIIDEKYPSDAKLEKLGVTKEEYDEWYETQSEDGQ